MNEVIEQQSAAINIGSVSIEQQRAMAEVQAKIMVARAFPRNEIARLQKLLVACDVYSFAEEAFYTVPKAGGNMTGPSIRLAEEVSRCYGHMETFHRELSRDGNKSEVLVGVWDMYENNYSTRQITVMHTKDKKINGVMKQIPLLSQKEIDDEIARKAASIQRGRIFALVPKWFVSEAIKACILTLKNGGTESLHERIIKMTKKFLSIGVNVEMLESYIGNQISNVTPDDLVGLVGVFNAITKDGIKASEFFGGKEEPEPEVNTTIAALNQKSATAGKGKKKEPEVKAVEKVEPEPVLTEEPEPTQEPVDEFADL